MWPRATCTIAPLTPTSGTTCFIRIATVVAFPAWSEERARVWTCCSARAARVNDGRVGRRWDMVGLGGVGFGGGRGRGFGGELWW